MACTIAIGISGIYLSRSHIKPGIKTRSNSKVKTTTNCHARNMSVIRQQTNKPQKKDGSVA